MSISRWSPLVRFLVVTLLAMGAIWAFTVYAERILLLGMIVPPVGTRLGVLVADFMQAAAVGIWASGVGALTWYSLAQWVFPVMDCRNAGRRFLWVGIGVVTVIACTVYGFYYMPHAQSGGPVAYTFFLVNSAAIYYFSTVFASPPSYKYTPVGAQFLRRA